MAGYEPSQEARTAKWVEMLFAWQKFNDDEPAKVKRRVQKGIPGSMRRSAWNAITKMTMSVNHSISFVLNDPVSHLNPCYGILSRGNT